MRDSSIRLLASTRTDIACQAGWNETELSFLRKIVPNFISMCTSQLIDLFYKHAQVVCERDRRGRAKGAVHMHGEWTFAARVSYMHARIRQLHVQLVVNGEGTIVLRQVRAGPCI